MTATSTVSASVPTPIEPPFRLGIPTLLWLIAVLVIATLPFLSTLPAWLPLAVAVMAIMRLRQERRGTQSGRLTRLLVIVGFLSALALTAGIGTGLQRVTPWLLALLWIKLLELKSARDVQFLLFIGFFLVAGLLLNLQSLLFSLYAILMTVAIAAASVRFHSRRDVLPPTSGQAPPRLPGLRLAGGMLVQAAPLAVALFVLVPRPHTHIDLGSDSGQVGLSDTLSPGSIAKVASNQEVAFRVEFSAGGSLPPLSQMYWRGLVLWDTDGATWKRGLLYTTLLAFVPRRDAALATTPARELTQTITLAPHNRPWLFCLDTPVMPIQGGFFTSGLVAQREDPVGQTTTYQAVSRLDRCPADVPGWLNTRGTAVSATRLDPRIDDLATAWRQQALIDGQVDAERFAEVGLDYFRAQHFVYSLEPGSMGDEPVATFLFERRVGFCGHYATAFALLARRAGLPARVVIGYRGGEMNPLGDFVVVRQAQAHAWCELWAGRERGWIRVDPTDAAEQGALPDNVGNPDTAPAQIAAQRAADQQRWYNGALKKIRHWNDYFDASWSHWVLGYDAERQDGWLSRLGLDAYGSSALWALLAVAVVVFLVVMRVWARRSGRVAGDDLGRWYEHWCRRLARLGATRQPWEGPLAFAKRAAAVLPAHAETIRDSTQLYVRARYGGGTADLRALKTFTKRLGAGRG